MNTSPVERGASCRNGGHGTMRSRLLAGAALLLAGAFPAIGQAQSQALLDDLGHPPAEMRRAELRRALAHGAESPFAANDRRKLSDAERDALHRDLRNAMRGAYRDGEKRARDAN